MACRVEWTVSGRIDRTCGVRKAVRSWRPWWTPDTTARTSDGTRLAEVPASSMGAGVTTDGPDAGSGWVAEGSIRIAVLSGQGHDVQAAWLVVAGWPDAWSDAGRWRCPPLSRRRPDGVRTYRLGGHSELGVSGRPDGREVRHVRHPAAAAGCPQEELIGGDGVQTGVRRPHGGGSGRPDGLPACPARHGEVLQVPTRCLPGGPG
jgi:hypothetical protein